MHGWFKIIDLALVYSSLLLAGSYVLSRLISPQTCAKKPKPNLKSEIILGDNLVKGLNLVKQKRPKNTAHKPIVLSS